MDVVEAEASEDVEEGITLLGSPLPATDSFEPPCMVSFPDDTLPNGTTACHSMSSRVKPDPGWSETYRLDTPPSVSEPIYEANLAEADGAAELEAVLLELMKGGASARPKSGYGMCGVVTSDSRNVGRYAADERGDAAALVVAEVLEA